MRIDPSGPRVETDRGMLLPFATKHVDLVHLWRPVAHSPSRHRLAVDGNFASAGEGRHPAEQSHGHEAQTQPSGRTYEQPAAPGIEEIGWDQDGERLLRQPMTRGR